MGCAKVFPDISSSGTQRGQGTGNNGMDTVGMGEKREREGTPEEVRGEQPPRVSIQIPGTAPAGLFLI